jgi:hypothetical protein
MTYTNYTPNTFTNSYTTPTYSNAPQQSMGQGFALGANNFFGAGSSFLGNQFQQAGGAGVNQFGAGSNFFTSPSSFFGGGQNAFQQAGIYNGGPTMNVNFGPFNNPSSPRYGLPQYCPPQPCPPTYVPPQPMPKPPFVPQGYCPPSSPPYCPPTLPPYCPPIQPPCPPSPAVQTNYVGLAGDPKGYGQDLPGQTINAPQNVGFHNLYVNGEGFAGNAAGGQLAGILNRQQPLTAFGTAVQNANAQYLFPTVTVPSGIAVNSLVQNLNPYEPNKVANTQYGVTVGDYKVQLAGGLTQVIKPDGTTLTLKPDGTPFQIGDLATVRAGVTLPGAGEARTVLQYNEALRKGGTSTDLLTWGFRMPDGLGATERNSAGFADGVQRLSSNGNKTYYDFQVIQNAQAGQLG